MRVLAIRGRNLASLAGDFEVDFEAGPLADAGIFAITGPTGAGKSTLLDAMCLALFDAVPRLGVASRGRIENEQGDELSASDPRTVLRHGEGEGYAEIDFVGRDAGRYRARWSVQRARQKAGGRMQTSTHALSRIDTAERLGGTKTETLTAIREIVGLTAEQFRRAVLLAQGDFEAFIKANDNDRAVLLEKITGSQIYTTLGKAAYEKASALRQVQQGLVDRLDAQNGLDDASRAAAEAQRDIAQSQRDAATSALGVLDLAAKWETDRATLSSRFTACEAEVTRTAAALADADPALAALSRLKQAFALAPDWTSLGKAKVATDGGRLEVAERAADLDRIMASAASADADRERAQTAFARATDEFAALRPQLDEARTADRRIAETGLALDRLTPIRAERAVTSAGCKALEIAASVAADAAAGTRDGHGEWLAANEVLSTLAIRQSDISGHLADRAAIGLRLRKLVADEASAKTGLHGADGTVAKARLLSDGAEANHLVAHRALAELEATVPAERERTMFLARRDAVTALRPFQIDWRGKAGRAADTDAAIARLREKQSVSTEERANLDGRRAIIVEALPGTRVRLEEARVAGTLAEAAAETAAMRLRALLVEGDPCPVCGATQHHTTAIDALLGDQLEGQRARIATLEAELSEGTSVDVRLGAEIASLSRQGEARDAELLALQAEFSRQSEVRDQAFSTLETSAAAAGFDASHPDFEELLSATMSSLDAERGAMDEAIGARDVARSAEATARKVKEDAKSTLDGEAERRREAADRLTSLGNAIEKDRETLGRLDGSIDSAFGGSIEWRGIDDPVVWLDRQCSAWRIRTTEHAAAVAALPKLEEALAGARTDAATADALAGAVEAEAAKLQSALIDLQTMRGSLLGGRTVRQIEEVSELAVSTQRLKHGEAEKEAGRIRLLLSAATARKEGADAAAVKADALFVELQAAFTARLADRSLTTDAVAAAAAAGADAIEQEQKRLDAIAASARDAQTAVGQRRADLDLHDRRERPEIAGDALQEALVAARAAVADAQTDLGNAVFVLRLDDEVRVQTAALRAELERERETSRVWLELGDLIGDREGRTFRRFAQGLTLDRLLSHANERLVELKPRYALERGLGGDMLIQVVDHDMAGEVRGVHNLSGGERFLISLALALGLAEMSTGRGLRIESLFIDEGFGALDTSSLGQAIGVLEHLHATGRRVGVISHVEEVKERIPVKIEVVPVARGKSMLTVSSN